MKWVTMQLLTLFGLLCGVGVCAMNELYFRSLWIAVFGGVLLGGHTVMEVLATIGRIKKPDVS
jgi:uncharacterized membrane protein